MQQLQAKEGKANTPLQSPLRQAAPGVYYKRILFVNIALIGEPGEPWVLVDTGLPGYTGTILEAAETLHGPNARPEAILLTHGHFDHVGSLEALLEHWPGVPVYAHELELPYLKGKSSYPPPDPTVGGGIMPIASLTFPRGPIDIGGRVKELPSGGRVPGIDGWQWLHTPGHAPGHVSFWRGKDKVLVAGDVVVATKQESAYAVATQTPELHGPPKYFTQDWIAARQSAEKVAKLRPRVLITGHGPALSGPDVAIELEDLARHFVKRAVPKDGRYVRKPAKFSTHGVEYIPPTILPSWQKAGSAIGIAAIAFSLLGMLLMKDDK